MSTYAVSDMHGCINIYNQIKNFITPEDIVICLGDCGDRGPEGWKTIKLVMSDPQFIYLKGNHEDMTVKAMKEYMRYDVYGMNCRLSFQNGGQSTLEGWIAEGADPHWCARLRDLPINHIYTRQDGKTVLLNHSGADEFCSEKDQIWNRDHFWSYDSDCDFTVHGHTPIPFIIDEMDLISAITNRNNNTYEWDFGNPYFYCNRRKICIDNGVFFSGKTVLLNLDTFEYITFNDLDIAEAD